MPPVAGRIARILILGSMPGERSLAEQRYYAHPRNSFWSLMSAVTAQDLVGLTYAGRIRALKAAGVALWDVFASAARAGSLDTAIRDGVANDLAGFVSRHPELRAIGFNGGTASKAGRRALGETGTIALIDLPSSSPAYAAMPRSEKQRRWAALKAYLPRCVGGCDCAASWN